MKSIILLLLCLSTAFSAKDHTQGNIPLLLLTHPVLLEAHQASSTSEATNSEISSSVSSSNPGNVLSMDTSTVPNIPFGGSQTSHLNNGNETLFLLIDSEDKAEVQSKGDEDLSKEMYSQNANQVVATTTKEVQKYKVSCSNPENDEAVQTVCSLCQVPIQTIE
jgi:hypothetical protein